jgi:predicted CoA-binding protein
MRVEMTRQVRDPDTLAAVPPSTAELNRIGFWSQLDREEMDAQFRLAMTTAIECGAEHCATEPSTHFGTRAPIAGYQRD